MLLDVIYVVVKFISIERQDWPSIFTFNDTDGEGHGAFLAFVFANLQNINSVQYRFADTPHQNHKVLLLLRRLYVYLYQPFYIQHRYRTHLRYDMILNKFFSMTDVSINKNIN